MILIVKAWTEKCEHEFLTNPTENKLIKKLQTSYSDKTWMLPWSIRNSGLRDLPEEVLSREVTSWNSKLPFIIKTCLIKLAVKGLAHISWKHFWILWLCCTCLKGTCCLLLRLFEGLQQTWSSELSPSCSFMLFVLASTWPGSGRLYYCFLIVDNVLLQKITMNVHFLLCRHLISTEVTVCREIFCVFKKYSASALKVLLSAMLPLCRPMWKSAQDPLKLLCYGFEDVEPLLHFFCKMDLYVMIAFNTADRVVCINWITTLCITLDC